MDRQEVFNNVHTIEKALELSWEKFFDMTLPVLLGEACEETQFIDLQKVSHLLVYGGTKGERNSFLRQALCSLNAARDPDVEGFYVIGDQMIEWPLTENVRGFYSGAESISAGLNKLLTVMDERYDKLYELKLTSSETIRSSMPFIVALIDGIDKETESKIVRIASKGRAVGIHLILSVQSTSNKVITGLLRVNFPARITFRNESATESKLILNYEGSE